MKSGLQATAALPARVVVVAGATASGKTALAVTLARGLDGEVVGADSRQVFRYLDIGTAKPSSELRADIPHHMIDVVDPDAHYDTALWRSGALSVLAGIQARGKVAVVCGGTGLYLRSLLRGLFAGPAADQKLRDGLAVEEKLDPGCLHRRLKNLDPRAADRIHANDLVRTVRALEVLKLSGKPLSLWQRRHAGAEAPFEALLFETEVDRDELYRRIDSRTAAMVEEGLLGELAALRERGYGPGAKAFMAIGYREAGACLDGDLDEANLGPEIARATRRYAKRQLTWLRNQGLDCERVKVGPGQEDKALVRARAFLDGSRGRGLE